MHIRNQKICDYISNKVKKLLEEKGLSQVELSRISKISRTTINNIFHANRTPSLTDCMKLAKAFDITVDELIGFKK